MTDAFAGYLEHLERYLGEAREFEEPTARDHGVDGLYATWEDQATDLLDMHRRSAI